MFACINTLYNVQDREDTKYMKQKKIEEKVIVCGKAARWWDGEIRLMR